MAQLKIWDASASSWKYVSQGAAGNTGVKGDTGAASTVAGNTGVKGDTGIQGNAGNTGVKGDTGSQGNAGNTGVKGDTGIQGNAGNTGITGNTGVKGDTGTQGGAGNTGVKGDTGAASTVAGNTGVKGDTGAASTVAGNTGITGNTGVKGDTGVAGNTGVKGSTGASGNTGVKGDTGTQGNAGNTGITGNTGVKGDTGASIAGNTGVKGDTGTTVYGINTIATDINMTLTDASAVVQSLSTTDGNLHSIRLPNTPVSASSNHIHYIVNSNTVYTSRFIATTLNRENIANIGAGQALHFISSGSEWYSTSGKWRGMWVSGWQPTSASGCASASGIQMATNYNNYTYLAFDKDTIEYAYANIVMPDEWMLNDTVYAQPYWFHPATTTNFKVSWALQGVSASNAGALDVAQGVAGICNDTGGATSALYIGDYIAVTISGSPTLSYLSNRTFVNFRTYRVATDGTNDTLAVDAYLLGWKIYYYTG